MNNQMLKVETASVKPRVGGVIGRFAPLNALLLLVALLLSACVNSLWQTVPLEELKDAVNTTQLTLPAYDLTAAEWVPNQPLLVNKDFNFGMAMSMEGVGVAIAAGMRINKNKELAQSLSTMPPLDLDRLWEDAADSLQGSWREHRVLAYALLFGQPQAHLRTIVEFHGNEAPPQRYMDYSDWTPVTGEDSWTANNGEKIAQQSQQSLAAIVTMITENLSPSNAEIDYTITGGEAVQRGSGYVVSQDDSHVVVKSTTIPNTVLRIPTVNFNQMEKVPEPVFEEEADLTKRGD